jgi:hypothetical protein
MTLLPAAVTSSESSQSDNKIPETPHHSGNSPSQRVLGSTVCLASHISYAHHFSEIITHSLCHTPVAISKPHVQQCQHPPHSHSGTAQSQTDAPELSCHAQSSHVHGNLNLPASSDPPCIPSGTLEGSIAPVTPYNSKCNKSLNKPHL